MIVINNGKNCCGNTFYPFQYGGCMYLQRIESFSWIMGKNFHLGPNTTLALGYKIAKSHFMDCYVYMIAFDMGCPSFDNILFIPLFLHHTNQPCLLPRATQYQQNFFETDNPADFLSTKENMLEVVALTTEVVLSS